MKKILLLLSLLALLIIPNTLAMASTDNSQAIADSVTSHDNIKSAQVIVYEDNCIVAIQPQGIVTRSDYQELVDTLTNNIKAEYTTLNNVQVTRSVRVYRLIEDIASMTEQERSEAITHLLEKVERSPMIMPHIAPTR